MVYFTSFLIVALILYLVINPFFSTDNDWESEEIEDDLEEVSLEHLYVTINELEMEYNMGKVSKDDFLKLKNHYEALAVKKLKERSQLEGKKNKLIKTESTDKMPEVNEDIEREIELELEQFRKKRGNES